ncbi:centrosomal protein of 164 kDa isoform X3 [Denticeps clupeoides]|uniref:centrosomal protein of 164 kDa isoform X3 n=1 Tax=Denticeps clupeoides TaxID=299321 RepID=UPI0010A46944|nr:centrosomal protein of 164 kDa isoform X3 [Denticeps clupeoides]
MSAAALQIGDQLILEEDYDENYIPSEQEIHEYAREIGIDPDEEPELLWLAREGIVAPLPNEWKPCQDVTGDLYYFNFASGQSTWDHPCDEQYRQLVKQERDRIQARPSKSTTASSAKKDKDKKKKKDKKEKKEKKEKKKEHEVLKPVGSLSSGLAPLQASLGSLAPLRGLGADAPVLTLRASHSSSGGLEPLKSSAPGALSSAGLSMLGGKQGEQVTFSLPGFEDEDKASEDESPRGTAHLMHNLHLDLDDLGGGIHYEDSELSGTPPPEERTEPELQDLALSGEHSPEPPSQDSLHGRHLHSSLHGGNRDCSSTGVFPPSPDLQLNSKEEGNENEESVAEEDEDEKGIAEEDDLAAESQPGRDGDKGCKKEKQENEARKGKQCSEEDDEVIDRMEETGSEQRGEDDSDEVVAIYSRGGGKGCSDERVRSQSAEGESIKEEDEEESEVLERCRLSVEEGVQLDDGREETSDEFSQSEEGNGVVKKSTQSEGDEWKRTADSDRTKNEQVGGGESSGEREEFAERWIKSDKECDGVAIKNTMNVKDEAENCEENSNVADVSESSEKEEVEDEIEECVEEEEVEEKEENHEEAGKIMSSTEKSEEMVKEEDCESDVFEKCVKGDVEGEGSHLGKKLLNEESSGVRKEATERCVESDENVGGSEESDDVVERCLKSEEEGEGRNLGKNEEGCGESENAGGSEESFEVVERCLKSEEEGEGRNLGKNVLNEEGCGESDENAGGSEESDEVVERCLKSEEEGEGRNLGKNVLNEEGCGESDENAGGSEESDEVVERCLKSEEEGEGRNLGKNVLNEEGCGESKEATERCVESDENVGGSEESDEVVERCLKSEEEIQKEGNDDKTEGGSEVEEEDIEEVESGKDEGEAESEEGVVIIQGPVKKTAERIDQEHMCIKTTPKYDDDSSEEVVERCKQSIEETNEEEENIAEVEGTDVFRGHKDLDQVFEKENKKIKDKGFQQSMLSMNEDEGVVDKRVESPVSLRGEHPKTLPPLKSLHRMGCLRKMPVPHWDPGLIEDTEASEHIEEASSSHDASGLFRSKFSENILDLKDLSASASPVEKEDENDKVQILKLDDPVMERKRRAEATDMGLLAADTELLPAEDKLQLEVGTPDISFSSSSHSPIPGLHGDMLKTRMNYLDKRPETSRGRLVRSAHAKEEEEKEEQKRRNEEDDKKRKEEERTKKEENERKRKEEEEIRKEEERKNWLEEDQKRRKEEEFKEEEEKKRQEEDERRREEDRKKMQEEERNKIQDELNRKEEYIKRQEEELERKEEELKRMAEERKRKEDERKRKEDKGRIWHLQQERRREEEESEVELEEEKLKAQQERERRLLHLREELMKEEEEEEQKLKEENEEKIRSLRLHLQKVRHEEEANLSLESERKLQELRDSTLREREVQHRILREESETRLRELREALEIDRQVERDRLDAQRRRELEKLREELELELQTERRRLQERREEQLACFKQEALSSENQRDVKSPRLEQHLADYQRELGDVLQEMREEVQREHNRKLEQLRDEHRQQLQDIREKHLEEENSQRERLLNSLQEDRERILASNTSQLEKLRDQLDSQLQQNHRTFSQKEAELQKLGEHLEIRSKDLKAQETLLQVQATELMKRRQELLNEEDVLQRETAALPRVMQQRDELQGDLERMKGERDRARDEAERLKAERDRAREENWKLNAEREKLETKVQLLQERCERLSRRVSGLEKREKLPSSSNQTREQTAEEREQKKKDSATPGEQELCLNDLEPPLSPLPQSRGSESGLDDLRQYISTEGAFMQRARCFLEQQSGNLSERQAALRAASSNCLQEPVRESVTQELYKNLQQEASNLEHLKETVQKGQSLLRKKAEKLNQLQNSLAEELSYDDVEGPAADRKVTFDVTESELSSMDSHNGAVPAKVQELTESLQQISGQLNTVLGALGFLTQRQAPAFTSTQLPYHPLTPPLSQYRVPAPLSTHSWAWPPAASSSISTGLGNGLAYQRGLEDTVMARWNNLLPGLPMDTSGLHPARSHSTLSAYSEHLRSLSSAPSNSALVDGQRLQSLIDGNKRWLELRRKDPSIPLFPRYRPSSNVGGLVQLSLDDNNQIKVYRY